MYDQLRNKAAAIFIAPGSLCYNKFYNIKDEQQLF